MRNMGFFVLGGNSFILFPGDLSPTRFVDDRIRSMWENLAPLSHPGSSMGSQRKMLYFFKCRFFWTEVVASDGLDGDL